MKARLLILPREDAPDDWREHLCRVRGVQFVCVSGRGVVVLVDDEGMDGVRDLCGRFCEIEEKSV